MGNWILNLSMEKKRIIITGGDGFVGWPFSLRMSNLGW